MKAALAIILVASLTGCTSGSLGYRMVVGTSHGISKVWSIGYKRSSQPPKDTKQAE